MNVDIIGAGFVGLTNASVLRNHGHNVTVWESDPEKLSLLRDGFNPFFETGVSPAGLDFKSPRADDQTDESDVVMICVGTPSKTDGSSCLKALEGAVKFVRNLRGDPWILIRSTVPVGTTRRLAREYNLTRLVHHPEFLAEGTAVRDMTSPERLVFGHGERESNLGPVMDDLYGPVLRGKSGFWLGKHEDPTHVPDCSRVLFTDYETSELSKLASNFMLASRIASVNAIAHIAEASGADYHTVSKVLGADQRIGKHFLRPGAGYGGSCFPKDVRSLAHQALHLLGGNGVSSWLFEDVCAANAVDREWPINVFCKIGRPSTIAVFGLSFKPGTSDTRESPSIDLIKFVTDSEASPTSVYYFDELSAFMDDVRSMGINRVCDPSRLVELDAGAIFIMHDELPFTWEELVEASHNGAAIVDVWASYYRAGFPVDDLPRYICRGRRFEEE